MKWLTLCCALSAVTAAADDIALQQVASGINSPVAITHAGDARLFVTSQRGRVFIASGGSVAAQPFLDISSLVSCCNERGLLSVAFHPQYQTNGLLFIDYTNTGGNTVIARYRVSSTDPNRADASSGQILLTIAQPFANHNGGQLQFGPDGYLYIGMGDGGSAGDPENRAQNLGVLLGKLLRIDVDHGAPYSVPATNPFSGRSGAQPEIWAYGLRNPWRFSFDRLTGDLWIADVGQDRYEEVDLQPRSSTGGENYGWRPMEGAHCFNPSTNCQTSSMTLPILEYSHADGACSITGGYRYRGAKYPRLNGTYFYADYCSGVVFGATENADHTWSARAVAQPKFAITTFGEDANGELYLADYNHGTIYAITDPVPLPPRRRAVRH
jgi:glucose/arabinose dehydrogenase